MTGPVTVGGGDHGAGVFSTTFAFTVFLVFLLFAAQMLFGLYARTTVTAVAADLAQRAADDGAPGPVEIEQYRIDARERLGRYGDQTSFTFSTIDADGDGADDTVAVRVDAALPTLLPLRWAPASPTHFTRTVRARIETFQVMP